MAPRKRKGHGKRKSRDALMRWPIYILSVIISASLIFNIAVSFMNSMKWEENVLFKIVLPALLTPVGITVVVYLPWFWFSRKEITRNYMDFKNTLLTLFSDGK